MSRWFCFSISCFPFPDHVEIASVHVDGDRTTEQEENMPARETVQHSDLSYILFLRKSILLMVILVYDTKHGDVFKIDIYLAEPSSRRRACVPRLVIFLHQHIYPFLT